MWYKIWTLFWAKFQHYGDIWLIFLTECQKISVNVDIFACVNVHALPHFWCICGVAAFVYSKFGYKALFAPHSCTSPGKLYSDKPDFWRLKFWCLYVQFESVTFGAIQQPTGIPYIGPKSLFCFNCIEYKVYSQG